MLMLQGNKKKIFSELIFLSALAKINLCVFMFTALYAAFRPSNKISREYIMKWALGSGECVLYAINATALRRLSHFNTIGG